MNNQRRKEIDRIIADIEALRGSLEDIQQRVEDVLEEENDAIANLPESLQDGERGQAMQECADQLDAAWNMLNEFDLDDLTTNLEEAKGNS